jgi:hypothetical protein
LCVCLDELIESFLGEARIWLSGLQTAREAGNSTRIRSAAHARRSGASFEPDLLAEHERAIAQLKAERGDPQAP